MKFKTPKREREETEPITFRDETRVKQAFEAECAKDGVSLSEGLRQLIRNFLKLRGKHDFKD